MIPRSYSEYLANRGYERATVERSSTNATPGDLVLERTDRPARTVERAGGGRVVQIKGRTNGVR